MEPGLKYQGSLRQTLEEIEASGGTAIAIQADLSKAEDRERLFAEVAERLGAPDILGQQRGGHVPAAARRRSPRCVSAVAAGC
jgi:NAD(P)-dependent dehydrogenase (short-subunit alcohol dehydrogenase family)